MEKALRETFNKNFTEEKYAAYMKELEGPHPGKLLFRNAETPIFIGKDFKNLMLGACEDIIDTITAENFKKITQASIPANLNIPNEDDHTQFIVFDFGICKNEAGEMVPQLIEMQGFPTLYAFQAVHSELTAKYANLPENYSSYLSGYNKESYLQLFKEIVLEDENPENVILLEIKPEEQKTKIDFYFTEDVLGIKTVCLTKLMAEGNKLYYENEGKKIQVKRIYNRLIFDDLAQYEGLETIDLSTPYEVTWVPHPNWFYRISKYTLPFIDNDYVPATFFLNELKEPVNLADYVLKPLFSFAGMGVIIDVTQEDVDNIKDPENWILQKKVQYDAIIPTMDENAKAEIRLFYFWKKEWKRPIAVNNLARLSKGKMIGTRYNMDKTWVGGSVAFFEKD